MQDNMKNPDQELQNGWVLVMVLLFSVTRTVQLFSRVPGTCGMWHFGVIYFLGFAIQLLYYQTNVESSGHFDAIPHALFLFGSLGVLMFHNLASWWRGQRAIVAIAGTPVLAFCIDSCHVQATRPSLLFPTLWSLPF